MGSSLRVYLVVLLVMALYAGTQILSKAAFSRGADTFVYTFYRTAIGTIFLIPIALLLERKKIPPLSLRVSMKIFLQALFGIAAPSNLFGLGLKFCNATPISALFNLIPVTTFFLAVLFGMERINMKRLHGILKATGVLLCFAGVVVMAFYSGPELEPINHHPIHLYHENPSHDHRTSSNSKLRWGFGVLFMTLATTCWSLWQVFQGPLLKEYPSKLLNAMLQSIFGTFQTFVIALILQRNMSKWKLSFDVTLLAVVYTGIFISALVQYLQIWVIEKRGPVFLAMHIPITLVITFAISWTILGEIVHLGSFKKKSRFTLSGSLNLLKNLPLQNKMERAKEKAILKTERAKEKAKGKAILKTAQEHHETQPRRSSFNVTGNSHATINDGDTHNGTRIYSKTPLECRLSKAGKNLTQNRGINGVQPRSNAQPRFLKPPVATNEWQTVTRKARRPTNQVKSCFKCFLPGHRKSQCKNIIKCFLCHKEGHTRYKCPDRENKVHPSLAVVPKNTKLPDKHQLNTPPEMDIQAARPELIEVYFEPRDHLNQHTDYLHRTGLIMMRSGVRTPNLAGPIAATIAVRFGWEAQTFEVQENDLSHYIVICPTDNIRDDVVHRGPYRIEGTYIEFDVLAWEPRFRMIFNPPRYKTWLTLRGAPLQTWSRTEISRLVQQFGYVIHICPYGYPNGYFRELKVIIMGKHPADIHKHILFKEGDFSTIIDVHIRHWEPIFENQPPPPPPPQDSPGHGGGNEEQGDSDQSSVLSNATPQRPHGEGPSHRRAPAVRGGGPARFRSRQVWVPKNIAHNIWIPKTHQPVVKVPQEIQQQTEGTILTDAAKTTELIVETRELSQFPMEVKQIMVTDTTLTIHMENTFSFQSLVISAPPPKPIRDRLSSLLGKFVLMGEDSLIITGENMNQSPTFSLIPTRVILDTQRIMSTFEKNTAGPLMEIEGPIQARMQQEFQSPIDSKLDQEIESPPDEVQHHDMNPTGECEYEMGMHLEELLKATKEITQQSPAQENPAKKRKKEVANPQSLRRSPRLQGRPMQLPNKQNTRKKDRATKFKLPFNSDKKEAMETSEAMSLLQTTGVQMDDEATKMIEEAINLGIEESESPGTPVHDSVPLRAVECGSI